MDLWITSIVMVVIGLVGALLIYKGIISIFDLIVDTDYGWYVVCILFFIFSVWFVHGILCEVTA